MKFDSEKVCGATAGLGCYYRGDVSDIVSQVISGDGEALEIILKSFLGICGDKTKQRLRDVIDGSRFMGLSADSDLTRHGVDYSDTPIRGRHYVYCWFDFTGELFYIGKGKGDRATNLYSRSSEFKARAEGGCCRYVAYNLDEIYAFDLEQILIWEALFSGKQLLNVDGGNGAMAIQYCRHDRDALLWYWDREGTIGRFSELTGIEVIYDARNTDVNEKIDSRKTWWEGFTERTNDPVVLEEMRRAEEKKRKQKGYYATRQVKKKQENSRRA